jgi:cell division protein FtsL
VAVAAPRVRTAPPRTRVAEPAADARRERTRRRAERPHVGRGVVWIAVIAALLAGIVALNVVVLQLRIERGRLQSDIVTIRRQNDEIASEISGAASVGRIEGAARRMGLVEPVRTTYLELATPRR